MKMRVGIAVFYLAVIFLLSQGGAAMALELKSSAFAHNGPIPRHYTCEGESVSPDLKWEGTPANTASFALICDDPDAPMGTWVHWVLYNIPADAKELPEGVSCVENLSDGSRQGMNDSQKFGYSGPCPPPGRPHRYYFKLYALDTKLNMKGRVTKEALLSAMEGHILAKASLMGTYKR